MEEADPGVHLSELLLTSRRVAGRTSRTKQQLRGWPASEMDSTEVVGTRNGTGSRLLLRLMVLAWRNQEGDGGGVEAWMENVCERTG